MTSDAQYFKNYAGSGKPYARVWRDYTYAEECIAQFKAPGAPRLRSMMVLGAATGQILKEFYKAFHFRPRGCELSAWAHSKIPAEFRRYVRNQDMRDYVREQRRRKKVVDLAYSNSLIYLEQHEVLGFLKELSKATHYLHFNSSFKGAACPDPARKTLKTYAWWNRQLKKAGFEELLTAKGKRTYLWKSRKV